MVTQINFYFLQVNYGQNNFSLTNTKSIFRSLLLWSKDNYRWSQVMMNKGSSFVSSRRVLPTQSCPPTGRLSIAGLENSLMTVVASWLTVMRPRVSLEVSLDQVRWSHLYRGIISGLLIAADRARQKKSKDLPRYPAKDNLFNNLERTVLSRLQRTLVPQPSPANPNRSVKKKGLEPSFFSN